MCWSNAAWPVEDSEVWTHEGREALAGLFGVEKKGETLSAEDPRPKLRLIINLVPSNTLQQVMPGDIAQLPATGQWNSVHFLQHKVMLFSSSDWKCFSYIFRLPRVWRGAMALEGRYPRSFYTGKKQDANVLTRYSIAAVPVGWVSAVGLCQHAHRRMLLMLPRSVNPPS